jgi:hypothetical protein
VLKAAAHILAVDTMTTLLVEKNATRTTLAMGEIPALLNHTFKTNLPSTSDASNYNSASNNSGKTCTAIDLNRHSFARTDLTAIFEEQRLRSITTVKTIRFDH